MSFARFSPLSCFSFSGRSCYSPASCSIRRPRSRYPEIRSKPICGRKPRRSGFSPTGSPESIRGRGAAPMDGEPPFRRRAGFATVGRRAAGLPSIDVDKRSVKVEVRVYPKDGVLDPQGKAIEAALERLGHKGVRESGPARSSSSTWRGTIPRSWSGRLGEWPKSCWRTPSSRATTCG